MNVLKFLTASFEAFKRKRRRARALSTIRRLARPLPPGWKFNRDEANSR